MSFAGAAIWVALAGAVDSPKDAAFDALIQRSDVVAVAGTDPDRAGAPLDGRVFELVATSVLKGRVTSRRLAIRPNPEISLPGYAPFGVWFLARRSDGTFGVVSAPDDNDTLRFFRRNRRSFAGLEPPRVGNEPVLTLGLDSRLGTASRAPDWPVPAADVTFLAQITNFGPNRTVLPPLDGSEDGYRYPKVILEITDAAGLPPKRVGVRGTCGVITSFHLDDFVELRDAEALTFGVSSDYAFRPGSYRARLHYVAKRSAMGVTATAGVGKVHPKVQPYLDAIWEGSLDSNWLTFTVAASPASKPTK